MARSYWKAFRQCPASASPIHEDWDLWLRLLHSGAQFSACPEPLLLYRIHPNSITSDRLNLLMKNARVYRELVLPHLSGLQRWIAPARYFSDHNTDIAYLLREKTDRRCLSVMTASILQWPFGDLTRYKVWLHMLLTRLRSSPSPLPTNSDTRLLD